MNPTDLIELLTGHTVYIQTHNFPDPDAMASAFGLQEFLRAHGLNSSLCYDGKIDKLSAKRMIDTFGMTISQSSTISEMRPDDYLVLVDGQKFNSNFTDLIGDEVACIDHHPTVQFCEYKYRDIRMVGACSSIIASYFQMTKTPLAKNVAAALAYGIKMDTADFTRGTTTFDTDMFAYVFEYADADLLNSMYKNVMEFNDLKAYAAAINNIKVYQRTGFAMIPFHCPDALIAIISDFILALQEVDVTVVYSIRENGIKFSIRSEVSDVDAGLLTAEALGDIGNGGGHKTMAGGFVPNDHIDVKDNHLEYEIQTRFVKALERISC